MSTIGCGGQEEGTGEKEKPVDRLGFREALAKAAPQVEKVSRDLKSGAESQRQQSRVPVEVASTQHQNHQQDGDGKAEHRIGGGKAEHRIGGGDQCFPAWHVPDARNEIAVEIDPGEDAEGNRANQRIEECEDPGAAVAVGPG